MQSVIKLSEATAIALHSMIYISKKGEETSSVKEIAQEFKISDNHLSKVLQRLVKAGYLLSSKYCLYECNSLKGKINREYILI